jgi:uncharacterized protein YjbI with pentapeptide repeats
VAPAFGRSADFAIDKPAGVPCPHLGGDFRCDIHADLRGRGFPGCTVFDCFGAGQQLVQVTVAGADWRTTPGLAPALFAALPVMRQLHELLWYLAEASVLAGALEDGALAGEARRLEASTAGLTSGSTDDLLALDVAGQSARVGDLLERVSVAVRGRVADRAADRRRVELVGARLAGADLHGASLRGAVLLGADLSGADLRTADLLGVDLRGADLRGADLTGCLFVTQPQLESARGDGGTLIPASLRRPEHWSVG